MRGRIRYFFSVAAAIAVAVHTVLWAALPPLSSRPAYALSLALRHSEPPPPTAPPPPPTPFWPAPVCYHCNLCSPPPPLVTPDLILAARLEPVRTLQVLTPANIALHDDVA